MASASAITASSNGVSPVLTPASLIAMMQVATPEEKATIVALLGTPSKKGKTTEKVVAAPAAPVDIGNRPAFPARLVLVDADKRCHARLSGPAGFLGKENGLPSGGFKCQILLESQCPKDSKSHNLCTSCSEKKEKGWVKGKGNWHGVVEGSVPKESHCVGGEWAQKQYDTMWGVASPSTSRSSPSPSAKEAPKEAKKEAKEKKAKKEVKKEEPKEVAVVAPPPAKVEKASGSLYFSEELDAFIRLTDRHIFATKVDDVTFNCIPDLDECLGMLKAGVKPEEAVPTDMEAIVEDEEEASEEESESE
jgi:hypothetical protein